ncbi:hypothetical protein OG21DRAFT_1602875 [Imleria badia]|nr:hypothetical protein OG21DRAFT_1602875 [Imleria badia]
MCDPLAHLAHEHPNEDSSPSSPLSETPPYFDTRRHSKSTSHQRSHTTTDGSRSGQLLSRLVSLEEEVREIDADTIATTQRLEAETARANAAERRALDYFNRLQIPTENRDRVEQEAARLREALKLCKLQLENAQKEVIRAQDIVDQVASQRNNAQAEAARAKARAGKLQEKLGMPAREEGRKMWYQEGLSTGRRIGHDEGSNRRLTRPLNRPPHLSLSLEYLDGDENHERSEADEERNDSRSHVQLRSPASTRRQPIRSESAPPVRLFDTSLHSPPLPVRVHMPSHENRTPSPPRDLDEPETIHPIISSQPISVPIADGWTPRADFRTSYNQVPPLHGPRQPILPLHSSVTTEAQGGRATQQSDPTPVSPPVRSRDYAYQTPVPRSIPHRHVPSFASRTSAHPSQYDLVNKHPGSSLQNEIYVGRANSGSQRSRESTSRNEHGEQDHRHSSRIEAENNTEQWRADDDAPPLRNSPYLFTPSPVPHPHQPPGFYYPRQSLHYRARKIGTPPPVWDVDPLPHSRPRTESAVFTSRLLLDDPASRPARTQWEIVTPMPLGDIDDPQPRRIVRTESAAVYSHPPPDDPASWPARTRWDVNDLHPRRVVPTESAAVSPYVLLDNPASCPARTRWDSVAHMPLRDVDDSQPHRVVSTESAAVYSHPPSDHPASWPARTRWGIVTPMPLGDVDDPHPRRVVSTESTTVYSHPPLDYHVSLPARTELPLEHPRRRSRHLRRGSGSSSSLNIIVESPSEPESAMSRSATGVAQPELLSPAAANRPLLQDDAYQHQHHPSGTPHTFWPAGFHHHLAHSYPTPGPAPNRNMTPQNGHVRTQTQSVSTSMGRGAVGGTYAAVPLPPGVMYPAPPVHPHVSHRRHEDTVWDRDRDRDGDRGQTRDVPHDGDWERERERVRDKNRDRRRGSRRDYERERDRDRDGDGGREEPEDTGLDEELTRSPSLFQRPISLFDLDEA